LHGIGIDWGCGIGCQAILAAKIAAVQEVYGLDISKENINIARKNAEDNGVAAKTRFALADSYLPFQEDDKQMMQALRGKLTSFSPTASSDWDDGFGFEEWCWPGQKST
jgi:ribosomal protein L11 methylase PrmA